MIDTLSSYSLIARDLTASLKRKAADPAVARDTRYYADHIGAVRSVDDFLADKRLYGYAMRAFGLEDMIYAKAFMRKVLTEGVSSGTSFANRLADDRYVAFARAFDFASGSASARGTDGTISETGAAAPVPARLSGNPPDGETFDFSGSQEARFALSSQVDAATTRSATILLNRDTLAASVADLARVTSTELADAIDRQIAASGETNLAGKVSIGLGLGNRLFLETTAYAPPFGGPAYAAGGANRSLAVRNLALSDPGRTAIDIGFGTALAPDAQVQNVTDAYLRQTIETQAGEEDTGVRLALYFARKAPDLTSAYEILGDPALSQVANTVLGLPATSGAATSEALARRASLIEAKIDVASFRDPAKLEAFVKRFAAIWDAQNNATQAPVLALFGVSGS
ncbi:DUF1217 domain-containing protein [Methylobacterium oxalidis]|uniref:DUF1217 domain-containing protein n=1 Tax=Methylobacterium oxalidis TaxID=944322 RepID=A0A512IZV8_9HYPH|nr:DUF1217 domain-containing protein [Methylobacterium oxalidis]GEP03205.1 hypothetical protein MOX02_12430 [Methylobacterium oxalidis]GJE30854.1 hypothetical protein LDDCCGHA_1024 [Methylobacterium oxalidis]GLS67465.1 hypothetical protein GCM10007888_58490 [Methylobacterium oxalidis]